MYTQYVVSDLSWCNCIHYIILFTSSLHVSALFGHLQVVIILLKHFKNILENFEKLHINSFNV
jgi:hypothetical protein